MLGSHNSLSYLSCRKWWMYLINWAAKCQSKTLIEQYHSGVRYFDIRVRFDDNGRPVIAHGLVEYKGVAENYVCILNEIAKHYKEHIHVRYILEFNKEPKDCNRQKLLLLEFVQNLINYYPNITCDYLMSKWNERVITRYNLANFILVHKYSSVLGYKRFLWIPYCYAKLHNKDSIKTYLGVLEDKDNRVLMLDFV